MRQTILGMLGSGHFMLFWLVVSNNYRPSVPTSNGFISGPSYLVVTRFKSRFYGGNENIDGALSYKHPTSKFTALYIMTSAAGDHNGAFASLEGGSTNGGLWNMCGRMLRMSSLYNVIYKRVNSVADATEFVKEVGMDTHGFPINFGVWASISYPSSFVLFEARDSKGFHPQVKNDPDFVKDGKALKHVTISGHGNPGTLVLGENRILSSELTTSRDTITKKFLKELKPALVHTGGTQWAQVSTRPLGQSKTNRMCTLGR